jgi:hypothetical protein
MTNSRKQQRILRQTLKLRTLQSLAPGKQGVNIPKDIELNRIDPLIVSTAAMHTPFPNRVRPVASSVRQILPVLTGQPAHRDTAANKKQSVRPVRLVGRTPIGGSNGEL